MKQKIHTSEDVAEIPPSSKKQYMYNLEIVPAGFIFRNLRNGNTPAYLCDMDVNQTAHELQTNIFKACKSMNINYDSVHISDSACEGYYKRGWTIPETNEEPTKEDTEKPKPKLIDSLFITSCGTYIIDLSKICCMIDKPFKSILFSSGSKILVEDEPFCEIQVYWIQWYENNN